MEEKETPSKTADTIIPDPDARILVCVHLINGKEALDVRALFPFPVEIKDKKPRFKPGRIRRRKGEDVPTNLVDFKYKAKENGRHEIHLIYPTTEMEQWDFITVRFCPADGDCHDHVHKNADGILAHVSGSTVHYGDAD